MKRFLSILLVAVLIVSSMATVAFAAGSVNVSVTDNQTVKGGDTVTLTVTVSGEFSNYELTMSAAKGLTIVSIDGVTSNVNNGKVAFSAASNQSKSTFTVTVKVDENIAPGTYKVSANMTKAGVIVGVDNDTEDGIADGMVKITALDSGSATLTVECGHDWSAWSQTKDPSCTEKGEETRTCSICGKTETRAVDMLEHKWSAWSQTKEPTCSEKGEETRTCSVCGKTETRAVDKAAHTWGDWVVTKPATCTEDGVKVRTCSVCGEKQTEKIPSAEGHTWGEWTVIKAATCTEDGEQTRKCSACGAVETEVIPATGHDWDEEIWNYDETHHWHVCKNCGEKCEHNAEHGPITEWQIVKEPTAKETGLQQKFCEVCGAVVASEDIPATGEGPIDPVPGTGDPTGMLMMLGGLFLLLLLLLAVALYMIKRKTAAK